MSAETAFSEVLEAADRLSLQEQESLVDILHRRVVDRRREELAAEIREAEEEYGAGECAPRSVEELMEEILE